MVHVEGTTADKESKEAVVKFIVAQTDAAIRHQIIYLITFCPRPFPYSSGSYTTIRSISAPLYV
jgi:hypothetical protein